MNLDLLSFGPSEPQEPSVIISASTRQTGRRVRDIVVRIELEKHVYLYADPAPEGFDALRVEASLAEGVIVGEAQYPVPNATIGGEASYGGVVEIRVPITLPGSEEAGNSVELQVRYQACTEMACYVPKLHRLVVPIH